VSSHGRGGEGRGEEREDEGGEKKVGGQRETRTVCPNGMEGGWVDDGKMVINKNGL